MAKPESLFRRFLRSAFDRSIVFHQGHDGQFHREACHEIGHVITLHYADVNDKKPIVKVSIDPIDIFLDDLHTFAFEGTRLALILGVASFAINFFTPLNMLAFTVALSAVSGLAHVAIQARKAFLRASTAERGSTAGRMSYIDIEQVEGDFLPREEDIRADIVHLFGGYEAERLIFDLEVDETFLSDQGQLPQSDYTKARKLAQSLVLRSILPSDWLDNMYQNMYTFFRATGFGFANAFVAPFMLDRRKGQISESDLEGRVQAILDECQARAREIVTEHKEELLTLARATSEKGTLHREEIYEIAGWEPS